MTKQDHEILDRAVKLAAKHGLSEVTPKGNEAYAWATRRGLLDVEIRIAYFQGFGIVPGFITVHVCFGQVRNIWENQTPLYERGGVEFSSNDKQWRCHGIAPKSRTASEVLNDCYIDLRLDPVLFAKSTAEAIEAECGAAGDMANGLWDSANKGWD